MMSAGVHLLIHNIVAIFSAIVIVVMAFFVIQKDHRRTVNVTLGLTFFGAIVAIVSYVIGVNTSDPQLARSILMWNTVIIAVSAVNFHCAMAILNREHARRAVISVVYFISAAFLGACLAYPELFIGTPVPKMYFLNYFTPGYLHLAFNVIFRGLIPLYFVYELADGADQQADPAEKKRLIYFALSFLLAWVTGSVPVLLTFDIAVDPLWGMLFPVVFAVPFLYAVVRYNLLDIRVVAKRAFAYAGVVVGIGLMIGFLDMTADLLRQSYVSFPVWAVPLIMAIVIVSIGVVIWHQLRESEVLKYEFITTVTHKFRTPLTHIKWASENLRTAETAEERAEQLGYIQDANSKLVELTDLLVNASDDGDFYRYKLERADLSRFTEDVIAGLKSHALAKKITLVRTIPPGIYALFDASRLRFVLQTFVENAVNYTPEGGTVTVSVGLTPDKKQAFCSVRDTGIGVTKPELSRISTKLYRGERARVTDTEGMGIGLSISKGIIGRHHGRMIVESAGENKGATFGFFLPTV